MGNMTVQQVKEYAIRLRTEEELDTLVLVLKNSNPPNPEAVRFKDRLLEVIAEKR